MKACKCFILGLAVACLGVTGSFAQTTASEDMKEAGKATKKAAKKTGHAVKKGSKKAANKAAEKTEEGAAKVKDATK